MNRGLKNLIRTGFTIVAVATIQASITGELSNRDIKRISKKVGKIVNEEINK